MDPGRALAAGKHGDDQYFADSGQGAGRATQPARVLVVNEHVQVPAPFASLVEKEVGDRQERDGIVFRRYLLSRKGAGEQVPAIGIKGSLGVGGVREL